MEDSDWLSALRCSGGSVSPSSSCAGLKSVAGVGAGGGGGDIIIPDFRATGDK